MALLRKAQPIKRTTPNSDWEWINRSADYMAAKHPRLYTMGKNSNDKRPTGDGAPRGWGPRGETIGERNARMLAAKNRTDHFNDGATEHYQPRGTPGTDKRGRPYNS